MKRVLFAILLLNSVVVFSQNRYRVFWTLEVPTQNCNCKDGGIEELLIKSSTEQKYLYDTNNQLWDAFGKTFSGDFEIGVSDQITLEIRTKSNIRNAQRDCTSEYIRSFSVNEIFCPDKSFVPRAIKKKTFQKDATCYELSFTFDYAVPIIDIEQKTNTVIGYDDSFNVSVASGSTGFDDSVYSWKYHIEGEKDSTYVDPIISPGFWRVFDVWHDMPAWTEGQKNFDIVPSTFLGTETINKTIDFKIESCDGIDVDDVVYYELRKSAPKIVDMQVTPPSCYDMEDGSVKIYFDRQVEAGESISYALSDKSTPTDYRPDGTPYYTPVSNGNNIPVFSSDATGFYLDIENIPPSEDYFFEIIGFGSETDYDGAAGEGSTYDGAPLYTEGPDYYRDVTIPRPAPVEFSIDHTDVHCNGGSDGTISLRAWGGTDQDFQYRLYSEEGNLLEDWTTFFEAEGHTISGLPEGGYTVKVMDGNGCVAKEIVRDGSGNIIGLGAEIEELVTLDEPDPLTIEVVDFKEPTANGFTNGFIKIKVDGGTDTGGSYTVEWQDADGNTYGSTTSNITGGQYYETLEDIGAGDYTATVYDGNHESVTDNGGCTISISKVLNEPDKLEVALEETDPISCNSANSNDEFRLEDGQLTATASGGVAPYAYTWKKKRTDGSWEILRTTPKISGPSVLDHLGQGEYAVNIRDANDIVLGDYENNALVEEMDSIYHLKEPDAITLGFTKEDIFCKDGNEGTAEVHITGGTAPYDIRWSNGATTAKVDNLIAGTYFVYVTDSLGCEITGSVTVDQPGGLQIDITEQVPPTCHQGSDGRIAVQVSGGMAPYSYQWDTGATVGHIENLRAGTYTLKITDAQGCTTFAEVALEDPGPVIVDLLGDRTLCNGQEVTLDIALDGTGATYLWESDNGFSSTNAMVTLTAPGIYTATVTTSGGCVGQDRIEVKASNADIDSHFLLASQAFVGDEVILVNVSEPLSEVVEWSVPEGAEIISQGYGAIVLKFDQKGKYEVSLRSFEGECYQDYSKPIIVEEATDLLDIGDAEEPFIKEFIVYPNPSDGNFTVKVALSEPSDVSLKLMSMLSAQIASEKRLSNSDRYEETYQLTVSSGTYILLLETPKGNKIRKVIIN